MYLPKMKQPKRLARVTCDRFGGLDRRVSAEDNTFADMENASADEYPTIGSGRVRKPMFSAQSAVMAPDREQKAQYDALTGVRVNADARTASFHYDGHLLLTLTESTAGAYRPWECRQIVSFHNYYLMFPYPYWVLPKRGKNGGWTATGGSLAMERLFTTDGAQFTSLTDAYTLRDGSLQFNSDQTVMKPLRQLFIRGELAVGSRFYLKFNHENANPEAYQFVVTSFEMGEPDYYSWIYFDTFDTNGNPVSAVTEPTTVTLRDVGGTLNLYRINADASVGAVHQGRVFGADTLGRSLYCSSYSDFKNWTITGTADGGGFVNVSSPGAWTALESFGGYLYALKADKLYRVAGSNALTYRADLVSDTGCFSQRAVCTDGGTLYYAGRNGVFAFAGAEPVRISDPLNCRYTDGAIGAADGKLWCTLTREDGEEETLTFDLRRGLWHKRGGAPVRQYLPYGGRLYGATDAECESLDGAEPGEGDAFSFTSRLIEGGFDREGLAEAWLRVRAAEGATAVVSISYDGGPFIACGEVRGKRQTRVPIHLRKCDAFQLRIAGFGAVRLDRIELTVYEGGRRIPREKTVFMADAVPPNGGTA